MPLERNHARLIFRYNYAQYDIIGGLLGSVSGIAARSVKRMIKAHGTSATRDLSKNELTVVIITALLTT